MKNITLLTNDNLFKTIGATPAQLYLSLNSNSDLRIHGSLNLDNSFLKNHELILKANICSADSSILYILQSFSPLYFNLEYETFTLKCDELSRFVDISKIDHIVLYPTIIS